LFTYFLLDMLKLKRAYKNYDELIKDLNHVISKDLIYLKKDKLNVRYVINFNNL